MSAELLHRPEARSASPGMARVGWAQEAARQRPALAQAERSSLEDRQLLLTPTPKQEQLGILQDVRISPCHLLSPALSHSQG